MDKIRTSSLQEVISSPDQKIQMSETVDYVVVGIGHPSVDFASTRFNAGYIFADYLANCVAMQSVLLSQGDQEAIAKGEMSIPTNFKKPIFQRVTALGGIPVTHLIL
jgi:hypothetical protein